MIDVDDTETPTTNSNLNNHRPEHFSHHRLSESIYVPSTESTPAPSTTFTVTSFPTQLPEDASVPQPAKPMSQPSMAVESRAYSYYDKGTRNSYSHHRPSQQLQQARKPSVNHDGEQDILTAPRAQATIDLSTILPPPLPPPPQCDPFKLNSSGPSSSTTATMSGSDKTIPTKRVASTSVDEASKHPKIQDLNLYTPVSTQPVSFLNGGFGGPGPVVGEPKDLICLCTRAPKVPRPRNAFILYRQHYQAQVAAQHPGLANPEISKLIGEQWREQPDEVKNSWKRLAEEEKARHQRQYPDYRYQPRRGGKSATNKIGIGAGTVNGEDPGRCQKCGGRFIATPRTPTTPSSAATPGFAKGPTAAMPAYMPPNANSRAMETGHLRRGSTSSMVSVDSHGRRYTQPYLRDIDEDYPTMSPTGTPVPKRQRLHGPGNGYMPNSPQPRAYMARPEEPRQYQNGFMSSSTPISASGFGPGSLPRLSMSQVHQQQQEQAAYHPPSSISGMQPPPRPSVSYQGATQTPVTRDGLGFDESLRLPPLQTRLSRSPPMNSATGTTTSAATSTQNALGIVNPAGSAAQQRQSSAPQRLQFLYKLEVLRAISPPIKPPVAADAPAFETRGPIIAIEGLSPRTLKDITTVVEKALSISGECAVKVWADNEPVKELVGCEKDVSDRRTSEDGKAKDEGNRPTSSIAKYLARMLTWHHTSEELTKYVTHHPPSPDCPLHSSSSDDRSTTITTTAGATHVDGAAPSPRADSGPGTANTAPPPRPRLPVAVVSTGYSLTVTERYAAALPIADAYRAEDHWRWVATLWRGVVGADLSVYVRACGEEELRAASCVDFANPAVLVVRVPESAAHGSAGGVVDEKLERRLGFEIMEWVRSGQFGRRSG